MNTLTVEEIKGRLDKLREEEEELRDHLYNLNKDDLYKIRSQYIGKYYKQKSYPSMEKHHRYYYVFGIEEVSCRLYVLEISYWEGNQHSHFDIQTEQFFEPEEELDKIEIDRDEFIMAYNSVQGRILKALKSTLK